MSSWHRWLARCAAVAGCAAGSYLGVVTGALTLDLHRGRRTRPLGPQLVEIAAPREVVFDVIAQPYLGRPTHAMADKVQVVERGTDLVLAAHRTPIRGRLVATTVETVKFDRPERVAFRLLRGPVPHVSEQFQLTEQDGGSRLTYDGEMAADLWRLGSWWSGIVARRWEATVAASLAAIKDESERRARSH